MHSYRFRTARAAQPRTTEIEHSVARRVEAV
jgi:hypothetical protein